MAEWVHHENLIATKLGSSSMSEMGLMMGFPVNEKWG